ncbi:hypothetical protein E4U60_007974, partial [Claviceps pazoutovae]
LWKDLTLHHKRQLPEMERTPPGRPSHIDTLQSEIFDRLKQLPKSKQRRIADKIKRGPTSMIKLHEDISTFRKYGTLTWHRVEDEPPADPNTATEEQLNNRILFYLNEYLVYGTEGKILQRRFCEDFEGWTTTTWLKVAKSLRTRLKTELEYRGLTLNKQCKENSDKLADIIARGYETSGETDWGSITSDDPKTPVEKGKQPVYNIAGPAPKTISDHGASADAPTHVPTPAPVPAPAPVPTFPQGHIQAPAQAPTQMYAPAPTQTHAPIPPHSTENAPQGYHALSTPPPRL